ncbi:MAG: hypothetical protein GQ527_03295 [Bacteroidales bacterium]|nr:hypothetical protein [Bacteroidales bacterium]
MFQNKPLIIDFTIALEKAANYCAYQERCQWDLNNKMREWNIDTEIRDEVIVELIQQNFLSEERFVLAFTRGKINIKRWGRRKIQHELKSRNISNYLIKKAINSIDEDIYLTNLQQLISIKRHSMVGSSDFEIKMKLVKYLISKGYETELINENIK